MSVNLVLDDCKRAMRRLVRQGVTVHSVVTDPPYGLMSIVKRFGNGQAAARVEGTDGSFARLSAGFMNQRWDGSAIERDVEVWRLAYDLLLPGGYLLAFSSPMTGHRMACAIEDAGFVMHPFIGWAYATGYPKQKKADHFIAKIDPEAAGEWEGYAYGSQARKPALEPIYVAQKPFSERNGALNILKHGVGAVDIDGCRTADGRHPANLIHDGSREVVEQFGRYISDNPARFFESYSLGQDCDVKASSTIVTRSYRCHNCHDEGVIVAGAGWDNDKWQEDCPVCHGQPSPFDRKQIFYEGKAGKVDRAGSNHPTVKPVSLMRSLVRHVTPPGGTVLDPFAGTGTTGAAALAEGRSAILIEQEPRFFMDMRRRFGIEFPTEGEALLRSLGF